MRKRPFTFSLEDFLNLSLEEKQAIIREKLAKGEEVGAEEIDEIPPELIDEKKQQNKDSSDA